VQSRKIRVTFILKDNEDEVIFVGFFNLSEVGMEKLENSMEYYQ
jgi:hypothetical protein